MASDKYDLSELAEVDPDYQAYLDRLPPRKRARILNQNARMQTGVHITAPMMCPGPHKCKVLEFCSIPEREPDGTLVLGEPSEYPIGQQCIVEKLFIQTKTIALTQHLGVDPQNPVEMAIVGELALIDMQKNRINMFMAKGDKDGQGLDFIRYDSKGFDENGNPIEESKIHPAMEMVEKLERRRERWLDRLMETRKAKAENARLMGSSQESEFSKQLEGLKEAIQLLAQQPQTLQLEEREAIKLPD